MPRQYVNSRFIRPIMSVLRCIFTALYLWIMMHAASLALITRPQWSRGIFWNTRLPDKLIYVDALSHVPGGEYWILGVIAAVLASIYLSSGCRLVGSQLQGGKGKKPRLNKICICSPYMGAFLGCWIFATYLTARQLNMKRPSGTSPDLYGQVLLALLFKILVLAHMTSLFLRGYVRQVNLVVDWNLGYISNRNLGERLNMLFRN